MFEKRKTIVKICLLALFAFSCSERSVQEREKALRLSPHKVKVDDDLSLVGLANSLQDNIEVLKKTQKDFIKFQFAERIISKDDYILALEFLLFNLNHSVNQQAIQKLIEENFEFYEVFGKTKWGEILLTSYFEPVISGSSVKTAQYSRPIYFAPKDLVELDLGQFATMEDLLEGKRTRKIIGRLTDKVTTKGHREVVPHYSREEIYKGEVFTSEAVICFLDPIESFFLQIQGSGSIDLVDTGEELRVGYAAQNGHPYVPIGKFLFDVIPKEEMSLQKIEAHLRTLNPEQRDELLIKNPSYVFFRKINSRPQTTLGSSVVDGRTLAADHRLFPKGALALLSFELDGQEKTRLVVDQDTGGAIKGGYRFDLFWGAGDAAKEVAGKMRSMGTLYYLAPKDQLIERLHQKGVQ